MESPAGNWERQGKRAHDTERGDEGMVTLRMAVLPERAFLDETALAACLGVSKRTVRRMVGRRELPPPIALAGRAVWQVGRVLSWLEARAEREGREAERRQRRLDAQD